MTPSRRLRLAIAILSAATVRFPYATNSTFSDIESLFPEITLNWAITRVWNFNLALFNFSPQVGVLAFAILSRHFWIVVVRRLAELDHLARPFDRSNFLLV